MALLWQFFWTTLGSDPNVVESKNV
jgi:hypothetical protein